MKGLSACSMRCCRLAGCIGELQNAELDVIITKATRDETVLDEALRRFGYDFAGWRLRLDTEAVYALASPRTGRKLGKIQGVEALLNLPRALVAHERSRGRHG